MHTHDHEKRHEALVLELNDEERLKEYKALYDGYKPSFLPKVLGLMLVWWGNFLYGKKPSYLKFRAVEVIARVPYQSWSSVAYTFLTMFFQNEDKAIALSERSDFSKLSQENETMHVVVVSQLMKQSGLKADPIRGSFIPIVFAFFYFWWSYLLYLINPKWSYELNYMFENHAFSQYDQFIKEKEDELKEKLATCNFLSWYGRECQNQYEFFRSVRNDEIIHRNASIEAVHKLRIK